MIGQSICSFELVMGVGMKKNIKMSFWNDVSCVYDKNVSSRSCFIHMKLPPSTFAISLEQHITGFTFEVLRDRGEGEQKDSHIVCISSKNCPELSFVYGAQVAIQKRVTLPKWDFPLCSSHWINTFFVPSYHSGEKDDVKQIGRVHNCLSCVKLFSKSIRNISRFSKKDSVYKK